MILPLATMGWSPSVCGMEPISDGRQIVLTLDDLPAQRAPLLDGEPLREMTASILSVLQAHDVPAVGFVNEEKLYSDGQVVPAAAYVLAGLSEAV